MATSRETKREIIEGQAALVVIDILVSSVTDSHEGEDRVIPHMPDYTPRMRLARKAVDKAHENNIPVIFIREVHRPDLVDFGRELDGAESIHCIETDDNTDIAKEALNYRVSDYIVNKRRYSAFFATDLDILLRGLNVDTLILCGGLTDVCVHYTFVDGHQHDYFCRVIEDCVAGSSSEAHEASLRAMEYMQKGARRSLQDIIQAMEAVGQT